MTNQSIASEVIVQARELIHAQQTLLLATVTEAGEPHISYAPFCLSHSEEKHSVCFYVYVSQLAQHSATLAQGRANAMLIKDERDSKKLFARLRLSFECSVIKINKDSTQENAILETLQARQGPTVALLRNLPDFDLFQLQPEGALLVLGFGDAHPLDEHLDALLKP